MKDYVDYLDFIFKKYEKENKFIFQFYIYENNSTDLTKEKLLNFIKNRKGFIILENKFKSLNYSGISGERGNFMCTLRNNLKEHHKQLYSEYVLLLDSDVVFTERTLYNMLDIIDKDNIVMVTPYCICWKNYVNNKDYHYYDSLAVITNDNISYKDNLNTCLFNTCKRCISYRSSNNVKINNKYLIDNRINKVKSAFGGFVLLKTKIYNKINWGNTICEHHSFCDDVNKYGDIVIAANIKTVTTIEPHNKNKDYIEIYKHLKNF